MARKIIPIKDVAHMLGSQRSFLFAFLQTDVSEQQTQLLNALYHYNQSLAELFGIPLPNLQEFVQRQKEVIYLEDLYRRSPNEGEEGEIEAIEGDEERSQGSARVDGPEIGSNEA